MYLGNYTNILPAQQSTESIGLFTKCNSFKYNRPSVNSLLKLVGNWLFDASVTSYIDKTQSGDMQSNKTYAICYFTILFSS